MQNAIYFPNLGIELEKVGRSVRIFGVEIGYYGILIGIALIVGIFLSLLQAKRTRQNIEDYLEVFIGVILFGVLGARMFYVAFEWDYYSQNPNEIFRLQDGGFAFYGALIGGIVAVFLVAKVKELYPLMILDTAVVGLAAGQAIGRWGDFFKRESFGGYTDSLFAMQIPVSDVRAADVTANLRNHVMQTDGINYIQVHPAFLYESLWCIVLVAVLITFRRYRRYDGEMFLVYLFGYGAGRFWIEGIRTDRLIISQVNLPVSQILSVFCMVFAVLCFVYGRIGKDGWNRGGGYGNIGFGKIKKKKMFGK